MEREADRETADAYLARIRERLPERTVRHTLSVTALIMQIAERLDLNRASALAAGMLHDLHKADRKQDLLDAAEAFGIPILPVHRDRPKLLHGPVAAEDARRLFNIDDAAYEAIYWHTTGRRGLGMVGRALYFADYSEALRDHPEADRARALLDEQGFDAALLYVADCKFAYVQQRPPVDPNTAEFHAWLHEMESHS